MTPKKMQRRFLAALLLILAACLLPATAPAAFVFQLAQVGPDVVVTGSGTLNLAALTALGTTGGPSGFCQAAPSLRLIRQ